MKPAWGAPVGKNSLAVKASARSQRGMIMLLGVDRNHVLERRFQAGGYTVVCAGDQETALEIARHHALDAAVMLSQDSLLNVAETTFNLRDLCPAAKIIVLLQHGVKTSKRFLRQLRDHQIAGSEVMTRRELQKRLREPDFLSGQRASSSEAQEL
ncbi:MAG: hypothetical protein ACXW6K_09285 [Candidatus Binatia bacterium]